MKKHCFKCGQTKASTLFYKHPMMADGRLGKCIECSKADARSYRANKIEYYLQYDRERSRDPARRESVRKAARHRAWLRGAKSPSPRSGVCPKKRWADANKHKRWAHAAMRRAVLKGLLVRQPCERCGSRNSHGHHDDYSKPLDVRWLCPACHSAHHAEQHEAERQRRARERMKASAGAAQ